MFSLTGVIEKGQVFDSPMNTWQIDHSSSPLSDIQHTQIVVLAKLSSKVLVSIPDDGSKRLVSLNCPVLISDPGSKRLGVPLIRNAPAPMLVTL